MSVNSISGTRKMQNLYKMKINDLLFFTRLITSNCSKIYLFNFQFIDSEFTFTKKRRSITGRVYFRGAKLFLSAEIWSVRKGTISIFINCLLIDWRDTAVCFNSLGRNSISEKFGFDYRTSC